MTRVVEAILRTSHPVQVDQDLEADALANAQDARELFARGAFVGMPAFLEAITAVPTHFTNQHFCGVVEQRERAAGGYYREPKAVTSTAVDGRGNFARRPSAIGERR